MDRDISISKGITAGAGWPVPLPAAASDKETIRIIPAIAPAALARAEDRIRAEEAGFQAHIAEPVESSVLVSEAKRVIGRSIPAPRRDPYSSHQPGI